MSRPRLSSLALVSLLATACAEDIVPEPGPESGGGEAQARVTHQTRADGTFALVVDAGDSETWVGVDLDSKSEADPTTDATWDLSFQRFHVRTRGGVSGSGGVEVATLTDVDFASLEKAPAQGYVADVAEQVEGKETVTSAFEAGDAWYAYDVRTHQVAPRPWVFVVKTDEGRFFKLAFRGYYDSAGTPAVLSLDVAELASPSGT